ncbi:hypothetical protein [Pseudomonas arcuscaelestis]|nr:hypothetical protein [Pseudomonas arcuscaelestis]
MITLVEQIDQQFNADVLDVSPEQWARLSSEVMVAQRRIRGD